MRALSSVTLPDCDRNRALVRKALDVVKPFLAAFLRRAGDGVPDLRLPKDADITSLLKLLLTRWDGVFGSGRPPTVKNYAHLLRDARNRWAHEECFTDVETWHLVVTAWLLAEGLDMPGTVLDELDALAAKAQADTRAASPAKPEAPREPPPPPAALGAVLPPPRPRPSGAPATPVYDGDVIVNAEELTADDVAMQRVRCPGCGRHDFAEWSAGWDAHAAHRCTGMTSATPEARKAEYRARFGHLFRGPGRRGRSM